MVGDRQAAAVAHLHHHLSPAPRRHYIHLRPYMHIADLVVTGSPVYSVRQSASDIKPSTTTTTCSVLRRTTDSVSSIIAACVRPSVRASCESAAVAARARLQ